MKGNPLNDPMISVMYENALQSLYAGNVMPFERQILAMAPLPDDVVDPYAAQDVDPNQIMKFAYKSLSAWIDESKKANYLSKRFTDLSKLVLKGVNTMGRGLMTLHNRGGDITQAPMQIGDLISVASYQFRKSYLGVMQTAASDQEISERLLINQLSWTNMLLRLYKTKDKLETPVCVRQSAASIQSSAAAGSIEGETDSIKLSDGGASSFVPLSFTEKTDMITDASVDPFSDAAALFEPSAISAPRALSAFGNSSHNTFHNAQKKTADHPALLKADEGSSLKKKTTQENTSEKRNHSAVRERALETENSDREKIGNNKEITENRKAEIENKIQICDGGELMTGEEIPGNDQTGIGNGKVPAGADRTEIPEEIRNERSDACSDSLLFSGTENLPVISGKQDELPPDQVPDTEMSDNTVQDDVYDDDDHPLYLQILETVFARGQDPEYGVVTFTEEEMRMLTADPGFNRFYPETAAEFRRILTEYDST